MGSPATAASGLRLLLLLLLPPRLGGERKGLGRRWGWQSRGKGPAEGRRGGGAGRTRYRPAEGPRARNGGWQRRQLATLGRGRGQPNHLRRPRGGGTRPLWPSRGVKVGPTRKRIFVSLVIRGLLMINTLQRVAPNAAAK